MRKFFKIVILTLVYLLFCGKACDDRQQEKERQEQARVTASRDSIREEFGADRLSEGSLHAIEATASQKLSDLAAYMQILTDTSLDTSFREKAGDMIKKMFVSDEARLSFILQEGSKSKEVMLKEWLSKGWKMHDLSARFMVDSILVRDPLHRISPTRYAGSLGFVQTFTDTSSHDSVITFSQKKIIDIFALKGTKIFGSDTLSIWEVFLGDMN